jgi:hypothetical protein
MYHERNENILKDLIGKSVLKTSRNIISIGFNMSTEGRLHNYFQTAWFKELGKIF